MRISNHISLLHIVGVAGAIGLAIGTGLLMRMNDATSREMTRISNDDARLANLIVDGFELINLVEAIENRQDSATLDVARQSAERWKGDLGRLRDTELGHTSGLTKASAALSIMTDPINATHDHAAVVLLREQAGSFVNGLKATQKASKARVANAAASLEDRRRFVMLSIGLMCLTFLLIIEQTRYWTARRLVRPVEDLANVALRAMEGDEQLPRIAHCGTAELNFLSEMFFSFVNTLKEKVAERTAELERQKADLEHEVAVRRRAEEQLRHSAFHDRLTGLCNRDLLMDRIDRCIERARRNPDYLYAVLFLDLDRFKEVNDSHGHTLGDQFLITISNRLQSCLRRSDSVTAADGSTIARIGGDEFVVLLDGISDPEDATRIAERIQEALASPIILEGVEFFTSASIGITTSELGYRSPDELLRDADAAMYSAKGSGKARHEVFNTRMHAEVKARLQLGNDLRRAVENEEFCCHYQPICALDTGTLIGFETLVRWQHPERGLVSPAEFIGHTEETGLVIDVGHFVLNQACRQLAAWRSAFGPDSEDLSVSVNVSMRQISRPAIVEEVRQALEESGIPGTCLKLEITESTITDDSESIPQILDQIKEFGVEIHLDDFGTGYSSLSYLHRYPLDVLKIDRTFLSETKGVHDYAGIVKTVLTLAQHLGMRVAVEGVETPEQYHLLRKLGADYAQGYYFAEPMNVDAATELLQSSTPWTLDAEAA